MPCGASSTTGGNALFIARVARADADQATLTQPTADAAQSLVVTAAAPGVFGNGIFVRIRAGTVRGVSLTLLYYRNVPTTFVDPLDPSTSGDPNRRAPDVIEEYDNLSVLPTDRITCCRA